MCTGTHYAEHAFLYPMGSMGHIVHSGASGARIIDALFFMLRWDWYGLHKRHAGTCYANHVFLHPMGSAGHVVQTN
jgi:hypothetical protein